MGIKYNLYEEASEEKYWIVFPENKSIHIFRLIDGKYIGLKPVPEDQILNSPLFPGLKMDLSKVFQSKF